MSGDGVPPGAAPAEAEAAVGTNVFADIFGGDSDSSSFGFGSGGGDDDLPGEPGVSSSAAVPGAAGGGLLGTLDAGEGASAIAEGADGDGSGDEGGEGGQRRRRRRKRRKKKKKKKKDKKKDKRKRKRSASQSGEDSIFGDPEDADAPRRKRKKKQTKPRKRRKSPEINPENMTDFDMAIQRLKKAKRKTRRSDDFIEDTGGDDMIRDLMVEMDEAAAADRRSNRAGEPALRKTLLLPKVRAVMENRAFAYKVVENGILKSVTGWMRPLPSGSFPSFTIRTTLMELLLPLPISTHGLKSSGLGKVIRLYVQKLKGDERKAARALVQKWIRPIVNSTADYRQLHQYDSDRVAMQNIPNELTVQRSPRNDGEEPEERLRAAIPWAEVTDFVRRPKSRIDKNLDRPKLSEQVPDLYKRINSRIRTMGAKNKKDRKQIATISVSKITPT